MQSPGPPPPGTRVKGSMQGWTIVTRAKKILGWTWSKTTVEIGPTHLSIKGHRRHGSQRIAWAQVAEPKRLEDSGDPWLRGLRFDPLNYNPLLDDAPQAKPIPALALRWTVDGRPARHAHELTEWSALLIGEGWRARRLDWLEAVVRHAQAVADADRRRRDFEQAVKGNPDDLARQDLDALLDDRD